MTTRTSNEKALARFMAITAEIRTTLDAIKAATDEHYDVAPEEIHWGHVGSVGHALGGLREILEFIRGMEQGR